MRKDRPTTTQVWETVAAERQRLVDDLAGLRPDAWATPSLCEGWDVHDVLAHLVDSAAATRFGFIARLARSRFDFDQDNAVGVARYRRTDPRETLTALQASVGHTTSPPAARETRLVEAFVHGEDIRRPLGLRAAYPADRVVDALRFQLRTATAWGGGKERAEGMRLLADDTSFEYGDGALVRGSTIALLLAISGRPVEVGELSGDGAARFATAPAV